MKRHWILRAGTVSFAAVLGFVGFAGIASASPGEVGIDPSPPAGSSGFYQPGISWPNIVTATPGETVNLSVTGIQNGPEQADATFSLVFDPNLLTYVSNGDTSATCTTGDGTVTCSYTDAAHSDKSDAFTFTVSSIQGVSASVGVTFTTCNGSASDTYYLELPAPAGTNGTNGTDGTNGTNGAQGTAGTAGTNGANGATGATGATGPQGASGAPGTTSAPATPATVKYGQLHQLSERSNAAGKVFHFQTQFIAGKSAILQVAWWKHGANGYTLTKTTRVSIQSAISVPKGEAIKVRTINPTSNVLVRVG